MKAKLNPNILKARKTGDYINPDGTLRRNTGRHGRHNNNTAVVGAAGSGKTNGIAMEEILAGGGGGSMVILDTKNALHDECAPVLKKMTYKIIKLDFADPAGSMHCNHLDAVKTTNDAQKCSSGIVFTGVDKNSLREPFWKDSEKLLLNACIGYLMEEGRGFEKNFEGLGKLLLTFDAEAISEGMDCDATRIFERHNELYKQRTGMDSWAYQQFRKFMGLAKRTLSCVLMEALNSLQAFDTYEMREMTRVSDFDIKSIADEKTVVFVNVSDTDRSKDAAINILFTQIMDTLCRYADSLPEKYLPVPVRFILDDFGSSAKIEGFENMISNIRSRGISVMILLQSISQLKQGYGEGYNTILANCGTQFYMGGSDPATAEYFSLLTNKPVERILNMPYMTHWQINKYGSPKFGKTILLDSYALEERELDGREP